MDYQTVYVDQNLMQIEAEISLENGRMTEELGRMLIHLVNNIVNSREFVFHWTQEDMHTQFRMETIAHCVDKFGKMYDPKSGKAFAFFNTVIRNKMYDLFRSLKTKDYLGENRRIGRNNLKANVFYLEEIGL